jgi:hypothetical protein
MSEKRTRRNGPPSLFRDTRGAAMTETVIMIPVFILIWACIIYIYQAYEKKIDLMQHVRADAWHYATNACEGDRGSTTIRTSDYDIDGIVGTVFRILGSAYYRGPLRELEAEDADSIDEPEMVGDDTVHLDYEVHLMCNEEPQELGDIIHYEAWAIFGLPEIL